MDLTYVTPVVPEQAFEPTRNLARRFLAQIDLALSGAIDDDGIVFTHEIPAGMKPYGIEGYPYPHFGQPNLDAIDELRARVVARIDHCTREINRLGADA